VARVPLVESVTHAIESFLADVRSGDRAIETPQFAVLYSAVDGLADVARRLGAGESLDDAPLAAIAGDVDQLTAAPAGARAAVPASGDDGSSISESDSDGDDEAAMSDAVGAAEAEPEAVPADATAAAAAPGREQVRVYAERLDAMLAAAGELVTARARAGQRLAELEQLRSMATSLARVERRRDARLLNSGRVGDGNTNGAVKAPREVAATVITGLDRIARQASRILQEAAIDDLVLDRAGHELTSAVRSMRMRPFADACEALPRAARDVAQSAGTQVDRNLIWTLSRKLVVTTRNLICIRGGLFGKTV
jgi:two-component system chemotaxis sensor kinase CheA